MPFLRSFLAFRVYLYGFKVNLNPNPIDYSHNKLLSNFLYFTILGY